MKLTKPDSWGNYYFEKRTVIYPSKYLKFAKGAEEGVVTRRGNFIVMVNGGFLFSGPDFRRFETPEAALKEIHRVTEASTSANRS